MLTADRDKRTCAKYSKQDETGRVNCRSCPLVRDAEAYMCKANAHYDRKTKEWEYDEVTE